MPGSVFKLVVGMAALEAGWNPNQIIHVPPNPAQPNKGFIKVGNHVFKDTAPPGDYDFRARSSFPATPISSPAGCASARSRSCAWASACISASATGLPTRARKSAASFPGLRRLNSGWTDGNTANMCIGQDPVLVTPLQIAVLTSAIANGGRVLRPRLVDRVESPDPLSGAPPLRSAARAGAGQLGVSERTLAILHEAMLADTEDPDGTGRHGAPCPGCGFAARPARPRCKTSITSRPVTRFGSLSLCARYERPRYAVVVMVEGGVSGGETCAPVAGQDLRRAAGAGPDRTRQSANAGQRSPSCN